MDRYLKKIKSYLMESDQAKPFKFTDSVQVDFLAQGEYNKNFIVEEDGKKYVFRINMGSQLNLDNQIEYEYGAIKKLEVSGVTPSGYFYDDSRTHFDEGVLMMNFLVGRPLDYKTDLKKAADIFSKIHRLDVEPFEGILIEESDLCRARVEEGATWLKSFWESDSPAPETKMWINSLYAYCDQHADKMDRYFKNAPWRTVNNTEVNSHNFIIGPEKSYLIDWEKPVISDPVQDITQFLAPTTTLWKADYLLTDDEIKGFYKTYETGVGASIEERVEAYKPFLYLRALSWCAGAYISYTDGSRAIMNESTFKVIKRYLQPDFMEALLKSYK